MVVSVVSMVQSGISQSGITLHAKHVLRTVGVPVAVPDFHTWTSARASDLTSFMYCAHTPISRGYGIDKVKGLSGALGSLVASCTVRWAWVVVIVACKSLVASTSIGERMLDFTQVGPISRPD